MGELWGLQRRGSSPTSSPGSAKRGGVTPIPKSPTPPLAVTLSTVRQRDRPPAGPSPGTPRRRRGGRIPVFPTARGAPAAPSPHESSAGRRQPRRGKGCGFTTPHSGLSRGQAALPAQAPPRRDPREIANPDRGRPARGDRDCSVTAPGTEPEPPLRTPTPAGHRGQLPSAFREGKNPTSQTFPTPCAAGIPLTHSITWRGKKKIKESKKKGKKKKKGKPSSPCSSRGR